MNQSARSMAAALAAGNTVLCKPSEFTSTAFLKLVEYATVEARFPKGVVSIVTDTGADAGAALVNHRDGRKLAFTGSLRAGKEIGRIAAERVFPMTLEWAANRRTSCFRTPTSMRRWLVFCVDLPITPAKPASRDRAASWMRRSTTRSSIASWQARRQFRRLEVLENNAELFTILKRQPFDAIPAEEWRRVCEINVEGVWNCCRSAAAYIMPARSGSIFNIASATVAKGTPNMLHYVASKGAAVTMTRSLAREFGQFNMRVNTVSLGLTPSDGV